MVKSRSVSPTESGPAGLPGGQDPGQQQSPASSLHPWSSRGWRYAALARDLLGFVDTAVTVMWGGKWSHAVGGGCSCSSSNGVVRATMFIPYGDISLWLWATVENWHARTPKRSPLRCVVFDQSGFGSGKQRNLPARAQKWARRGESISRINTGVQEWHRLWAYVGALLVSGNTLFALCCDAWMVFVVRVKVKTAAQQCRSEPSVSHGSHLACPCNVWFRWIKETRVSFFKGQWVIGKTSRTTATP